MDPKICQELDKNGFIVLKDVLTPQECDHYKTLLEMFYQKLSPQYPSSNPQSKHGLDNKDREKSVYNLHNKDVSFLNLVDHPKVFPYIKYALQQGSYENSEPIIHTLSTARSPKQGPGQQLHIDSRYPGGPFALTMTMLYCLDHFTSENGATRLVPGSHLRTVYPENGKQYSDEVLGIAPKGAAIIFNGGLWHGSSDKKTSDDRWGALFTYARWFIKPSFDFNKNVPQDIYNAMTDQQKELFGFKVNPPKEEFKRISARSKEFEAPAQWYQLPVNS